MQVTCCQEVAPGRKSGGLCVSLGGHSYLLGSSPCLMLPGCHSVTGCPLLCPNLSELCAKTSDDRDLQ